MKFGLLGLPLETAHSTHLPSPLYSPLILFSTYHFPCLLVLSLCLWQLFSSLHLSISVCVYYCGWLNWSVLRPKLPTEMLHYPKKWCYIFYFTILSIKGCENSLCFDRNLHLHDVLISVVHGGRTNVQEVEKVRERASLERESKMER